MDIIVPICVKFIFEYILVVESFVNHKTIYNFGN